MNIKLNKFLITKSILLLLRILYCKPCISNAWAFKTAKTLKYNKKNNKIIFWALSIRTTSPNNLPVDLSIHDVKDFLHSGHLISRTVYI
jgi:hypothetical protein